jgi:hypothetical protein
MVFINSNNIIGAGALSISLASYFYNKKIAIFFYISWLIIYYYGIQTEPFTTTKSIKINDNKIYTKSNKKITLLKVQIEDKQTPNFLKNVNEDNTFKDLLRNIELQINMVLSDYLIFLKYTDSESNLSFYILNDDQMNMTLLNFNKFAKDINKRAKKLEKEVDSEKKDLSLQQIKLLNIAKDQIPGIKTGDTIILKKKKDYDRLIFIIKNLTMINDENVIRIILENENITKPYEFSKLDQQKFILDKTKASKDLTTQDLEKITYTDYKKLIGFSNLVLIYGFTDIRIIELIKQNPNLASLTMKRTLKYLDKIKHKLNILENECLLYFTKKKK